MNTPITSSPIAPAAHHLQAADFNQKIGQMLVVGFAGQYPDDPGVAQLQQQAEAGQLGGVIFFGYNVVSPGQVRALIAHMAAWDTALPLLFVVDQEGGAVQRLGPDKGFAGWPAAQTVAQADAQLAAVQTDGLAQELSTLGFNFNCAPCVDLHDPASPAIGARGRSYGKDSATVAHFGSLHMAAHARYGVRSAIKHFPGHGHATGDTHCGLTDITETYRDDELYAFAKLINDAPVDAVMTSHLVHRGWDKEAQPVTFSKPIIGGILRTRLGFDGVVVTDDLGMGALVQHYGFGDIVQGALSCGHDLLVFGQNAAARGRGETGHRPIADLYPKTVAAVQACLRMGHLLPADVDASFARIVKLKNGLRPA